MRRCLCLILCLILGLTSITCSVFASEVIYEKKLSSAESVAYLLNFADVTAEGKLKDERTPVFEGSFEDVVEYMNNESVGGVIVLNGNVKLEKSVTLQSVNNRGSYILVRGEEIKFDLNGHTVTQQSGVEESLRPVFVVPQTMSIEITDSSQKENGTVNGVCGAVLIQGGNLKLSGGKLMAQSPTGEYQNDGELVVKVIDGGVFSMSGGEIAFDGQLEDGRTYYGKSCSIYVDKNSKVRINGGIVFGKPETEKKENLYVIGGSFDYDMTEFLPVGAQVEYRANMYHVQYRFYLPEKTKAVVDGETVLVNIYPDVSENETKVFSVNLYLQEGIAENKDEGFEKLSIDLTELFDSIKLLGDGYVAVNMEILGVKIHIDAENVGKVIEASGGHQVFFDIYAKFSDALEKEYGILGAKIRIKCCFTDENGQCLETDAKFDFTGPCNFTDFRLYSDYGEKAEFSEKAYKYAENAVILEMSTDENLVMAECYEGEKSDLSDTTDANDDIVFGYEEIIEKPFVSIIGNTLDIQKSISMIFYADIQGVRAEKVRMLFWNSPQSEYTEETAEKSVQYVAKDENGYRFVYDGIATKEMNKKIYARIIAEDSAGNKFYGDEPTEGISVVDFAQSKMDDLTISELLIKMLNYGAAAQEYFGNDAPAANAILAERERVIDYTPVYKSDNETIEETAKNGKCSATLGGKTLSLEGAVSINYYVVPQDDVEEIGMIFWNEKAFQNAGNHIMGTQIKKVSQYKTNGKYLVFNYDNISSNGMSDNVYTRIYTKKDGIYQYSDIDKYSIEDYVANQIDKNENPKLIKLLRAMMLYGKEAEKFFDSRN